MKKFLSWLFWPETKVSRISWIDQIILILVNLLPVLGILFFKWEVFPILLLYFLEGVIGIFFDGLKASKRSAIMPGIFKISSYFTFITIFLLIEVVLLASIFSISNQTQTINSIRNVYFWFSVLIFIADQVRIQIKYRNSKNRIPKDRMSLFYNWFKKLTLFTVIAIIITLTGVYTASLITIIIVKTFWDIRTYRKRIIVKSAY